jgi:LCP family protein required for cell wall assembly
VGHPGAPGTQRARRLRRTWPQRALIGLNLLVIILSLTAAAVLAYGYGRASAINRVALDRSLTAVPDDQAPGDRVLNILLVGSDSSAGLDEDDPVQIGRQGERFGDVIIIAHLDERTGQIALLSLPRDLWVELGTTGREAKINQAFVTGGPGLLIETIEAQFDLPIHHYVNVDFAGFRGLVAAIGSVEVWFDTPARDWNATARPVPRSQTGFEVLEAGCHALDPETALAYVRSRYYQTQRADGTWVSDPTSDLGRIRRQQDFLRRAIKRSIDLGARNPFVLSDLVDTGLEHVTIDQDLTPKLLVDLGIAYRSFEPGELQTYSYPAVDGRVGQNLVLMPRTGDAEPILELFRGAGFDSPTTVEADLFVPPESADPATDQLVDLVGASLDRAGFRMEPAADRRADDVTGLVIRHGPDGRHAAEVVAGVLGDAMPEAPRFEQDDRLVGRSLQILIGPAEDPGQDAPVSADDDVVGADGGVVGADGGEVADGGVVGADGGAVVGSAGADDDGEQNEVADEDLLAAADCG